MPKRAFCLGPFMGAYLHCIENDFSHKIHMITPRPLFVTAPLFLHIFVSGCLLLTPLHSSEGPLSDHGFFITKYAKKDHHISLPQNIILTIALFLGKHKIVAERYRRSFKGGLFNEPIRELTPMGKQGFITLNCQAITAYEVANNRFQQKGIYRFLTPYPKRNSYGEQLRYMQVTQEGEAYIAAAVSEQKVYLLKLPRERTHLANILDYYKVTREEIYYDNSHRVSAIKFKRSSLLIHCLVAHSTNKVEVYHLAKHGFLPTATIHLPDGRIDTLHALPLGSNQWRFTFIKGKKTLSQIDHNSTEIFCTKRDIPLPCYGKGKSTPYSVISSHSSEGIFIGFHKKRSCLCFYDTQKERLHHQILALPKNHLFDKIVPLSDGRFIVILWNETPQAAPYHHKALWVQYKDQIETVKEYLAESATQNLYDAFETWIYTLGFEVYEDLHEGIRQLVTKEEGFKAFEAEQEDFSEVTKHQLTPEENKILGQTLCLPRSLECLAGYHLPTRNRSLHGMNLFVQQETLFIYDPSNGFLGYRLPFLIGS